MVFLLGFYPHLPVLKQIEDSYRHWLHQRAFIPAEAKALIHQLVANPGFFKPYENTTKKVRQKYGQGMPEDWGSQQSEDHLNNKWFRLIFLREKLMAWRSRPEIYSGPERRISPRIAIGSQVMMRSGKESIPCEAVNISDSGAWIKVVCNAAVGDLVQLELPGLGWLNSWVVRKEEQDMAVTFQPDSKCEFALLNTIGTMPFAMA